MNNEFSLSKKAPPTAVNINGAMYPINAGYRETLKILRLFDDPDVLDKHKPAMFMQLWFAGEQPGDVRDAISAFSCFVRMGGDENNASQGEAKFDFEFDASEIYASFRQQYGIDLLRDNLHFWVFMTLLSGLGDDTAFGRKMWIRNADVSKYKGKDAQKLRDAKAKVKIAPKMSKHEIAAQDAIADALMNGGDVAAAMRKLSQGD